MAVLTRYTWLGLLALVVGTVFAYAQVESEPNFGELAAPTATDPSSTPEEQPWDPHQTPHEQELTTAELDRWLHEPGVWRLPPVVAAPTPPALAVPTAELIPGPSTSTLPPVANAPVALSGELPINGPSAFDPSQPEPENLWDGTFDVGLDGSEGNSETFNFRFGFHTSRKTEDSILTLGVDYNKSTAQTQDTANQLFFDGRFEWLICRSRWSWFVHETIEYDEFQSFNVRDTSDVGFGYRLIKNEMTTLIGRLGGGFSHEYGGPANGQYTPEAVFGVQLDHQISRRQKIVGLVEYAPDVGDFLRYRLRLQAAIEVLLDEERNLSMRMGVLDRYTSDPNGARPNDLDYAMVLLWKF